ncbi:hypothetical protein PGTUg99_022698 [Puccinia graminis f. sp. tritici]|nr:hypothetical protein PGTUg99_022698 [Puccinia graminis f. sp. tritici]
MCLAGHLEGGYPRISAPIPAKAGGYPPGDAAFPGKSNRISASARISGCNTTISTPFAEWSHERAIGYREFESLLSTTDADSEPEPLQSKKLAEATELTKIATRQYTKSQVKWMKNKFLPELNKFGPSSETLDPPNNAKSHMMTYILDASRVDEWDQNVLIPAQNILSAFLNYDHLPSPKSISSIADSILSELQVK